jgi:hypothetical protein
MPRVRRSPRLDLTITEEQRERAIRSNSGGCLIADAIKSQYPHLTNVVVDMATIRVSDRARGERYTYLCPPLAQHVLLSFDQGWSNPTEALTIERAVKVDPITRSKPSAPHRVKRAERRAERRAQLEEREARGETLAAGDRHALSQMRNADAKPPAPERPSRRGKPEATGTGRALVVRGGQPLVQGEPHPNLLRGRDRHFGAKLADPGQAFREAVEAALAEREQEQAGK